VAAGEDAGVFAEVLPEEDLQLLMGYLKHMAGRKVKP
jgi:hypothetical protein